MFLHCMPKSGSRNSTHNKWNIHARVIHYMGNRCCMVDKYRAVIILLIWFKSSRHMIGMEGPRYMVGQYSIYNANYILNNTTFLAHKKVFVRIWIILYALSINQKFLKVKHPTPFLIKDNLFNLLLAHYYLFTLLAAHSNAVKLQ